MFIMQAIVKVFKNNFKLNKINLIFIIFLYLSIPIRPPLMGLNLCSKNSRLTREVKLILFSSPVKREGCNNHTLKTTPGLPCRAKMQ